jgi:putative addiction module component (TIGR02574 family)
MSTPDDIFDAVQALSLTERWRLVNRLWEALPDEASELCDPAEIALLDERMAEIESGKVDTVPGEVVKKWLRERIQANSQSQ